MSEFSWKTIGFYIYIAASRCKHHLKKESERFFVYAIILNDTVGGNPSAQKDKQKLKTKRVREIF